MKFRKRVLIFPIIMVACLMAVIYVANATPQKTEVTAKMPVEKQEPKLKYPYSVDQIKPEVTEAVVEETTPEPTPTSIPTPTPEPTPEPVVEEQTEPIAEEVVEVVEIELIEEVYDSDFEGAVETGNYYEDLPNETSEVWQQDTMQPLGVQKITWYSWERCGNNIGAAEIPGGMIPGYSCAMPDYGMLGAIIYIEGYGERRVDDVSNGPVDLFVTSDSEIPSYGVDYQPVYLVGWAY